MGEQPLSRRAMIAGGAGAAALSLLGAAPAAAAPGAETPGGSDETLTPSWTATPRTAGLSYAFYSGWSMFPIASAQTWSASGASFSFTTPAGSGYARVPLSLPPGTRIAEVEVYGNRTVAGGAGFGEVWSIGSDGPAAVADQIARAAAPASTGPFTLTLPIDPSQGVLRTDYDLVPFVYAEDASVRFVGVRVGYVGPTQLFLLPAPQRVYDSRPANGGAGPIANGQVRTISLAPGVPAGARAALLTLTLDNTTTSGYLQVFAADQASTSASSVNWFGSGQTLANTVVSAVDGSARVKVAGGGGTTNFLVDVVGYFQ